MIVRLAAEAERDLDAIADYIAKDSIAAALAFTDALREACSALGSMPRAFPLLDGYEPLGLRRRAYRNYLIIYRIDADAVTVIHIAHGARDLGWLLDD